MAIILREGRVTPNQWFWDMADEATCEACGQPVDLLSTRSPDVVMVRCDCGHDCCVLAPPEYRVAQRSTTAPDMGNRWNLVPFPRNRS